MFLRFNALFRDADFREEISEAVELLTETNDCAVIAVPSKVNGDTVFRLAIHGLRDISFGEMSLPLPDTLCATVLERHEMLAVGNISSLSIDRSSAFMKAENFRAFLGAPIASEGPDVDAVLAVLSRAAKDWTATDIENLANATFTVAAIVRFRRG